MCMCLVCGVGRAPWPACGPWRARETRGCTAVCAVRRPRGESPADQSASQNETCVLCPPRPYANVKKQRPRMFVIRILRHRGPVLPSQRVEDETRARQRETVQQCKFSYGSVRPGSVHCGARRRERPDWRRRASLRLAALRRPRGACRACQSANASTRPPAGRGGRVAVTPLHRWLRASSDCPVTFVCSGEWLGAWWAMSQRRFCRRARCEAASWMAAAARSSA